MNGVDGLAPPRPVVSAPEDLAGCAMGRDGELTVNSSHVTQPSETGSPQDLVSITEFAVCPLSYQLIN